MYSRSFPHYQFIRLRHVHTRAFRYLLTLFAVGNHGLCSYLLIGFLVRKRIGRNAASKASWTTRVGDVFMLLGIAFLYSATGSLLIMIFSSRRFCMLWQVCLRHLRAFRCGLIGLLLFIGTVGKSAQFPLHVWLPDAMEAPRRSAP